MNAPRVNQYAAPCEVCGGEVPAGGGRLERNGRRWAVAHQACVQGEPGVVVFRFNSGREYTRNRAGRCIDAPCCGCCSY